jgi:transposase
MLLHLQDSQWQRILSNLRQHPQVRVGSESECRRFVEAVLWMTRSGSQWRLLPSEYGNWNSIYKRFARWSELGIWEQLHQGMIDCPDREHLIPDIALTSLMRYSSSSE